MASLCFSAARARSGRIERSDALPLIGREGRTEHDVDDIQVTAPHRAPFKADVFEIAVIAAKGPGGALSWRLRSTHSVESFGPGACGFRRSPLSSAFTRASNSASRFGNAITAFHPGTCSRSLMMSDTDNISVPRPDTLMIDARGLTRWHAAVTSIAVFERNHGGRRLEVNDDGRRTVLDLDAAQAAHLAALLTPPAAGGEGA